MKTYVYHLIVNVLFFYSQPVTSSKILESMGCPPGWTYNEHGNHCFYIPNLEVGDMGWEFARLYCLSLYQDPMNKSGLVTLSNEMTRKVISDAMSHSEFWTGLKLEKGKFWKWGTTGKVQDILEFNDTEWKTTDSECVSYKITFQFRNCVEYEALPVCEIADVDPCQEKNGGCQHFCYNDGFQKSICACRPGFVLKGGTNCTAINSCDIENGGCDHNCHEEGVFSFCECDIGYKLIDHTKCEDVDECTVHNGGCEHNCTNKIGSRECSCLRDFIKDGPFCRYEASPGIIVSDPLLKLKIPIAALILSGTITLVLLIGGSFMVNQDFNELKRTKARHDLRESPSCQFKQSEARASPSSSDSFPGQNPPESGQDAGPKNTTEISTKDNEVKKK